MDCSRVRLGSIRLDVKTVCPRPIMWHKKVHVSGRMTIAQQFTAGNMSKDEYKSVNRTADQTFHMASDFSRPLHGLDRQRS